MNIGLYLIGALFTLGEKKVEEYTIYVVTVLPVQKSF